MKTITTLTGGLDSSYLLGRLLEETDDEITAFCAGQKRGDPLGVVPSLMAEQIEGVRSWLSKIRPFSFEVIEVPHLLNEPGMCGIIRYAAKRCHEGGFGRFCSARTTDNQRAIGTAMLPKYHAWWARHCSARLEFPLLDQGLGRAHIWLSCNPELRELTTGCNNLRLDGGRLTRCGQCVKCQLDADIGKFLAAGYSADQIADYHWRARAAWKYVHLRGEDRFRYTTQGDPDAALND